MRVRVGDRKTGYTEKDTDATQNVDMGLAIEPVSPSKFILQNLLDLNDPQKAYKSPLAVICHVDINAFFAQYEQNRLNLSADDPVVCLQWNSLIAVSYAARKFGINRMDTLQSARDKCPNLIPVHTAVFKKGEPTWKYTDYRPIAQNHKVSLDPYRRASRKMMRIFQDFCDLVEKASVDESFMDFGRLVYRRVVELCPGIADGEKDEALPDIPMSLNLEWRGVVTPVDGEGENPVLCDWDDVVILIGSNLAQELRQRILSQLNYTTSAGVARVKTLAKLASGYRKPDCQTIVRSRAIPDFLKQFAITDFWSMGGKIGELVTSRLSAGTVEEGDDTIGYIRDHYSLKELVQRLDGDKELAERVYDIVRGELRAPLSSRIEIKSMMSNKNFGGHPLRRGKDMLPWFEVFIGDLVLRLQDLDEENGSVLRPTRLSLTMKCGSSNTRKSKQATIGPVKEYSEATSRLKQLAQKLLEELEQVWKDDPTQPAMYPCTGASLVISGFKSLEGFARIDEMMKGQGEKRGKERVEIPEEHELHTRKKAKTGIQELLKRKPPSSDDYVCPECHKIIPPLEIQEHKDFHLAVKLSLEMNGQDTQSRSKNTRQSHLPFKP